ncbi:Luminescence regulatory protein LuxO [Rubripirellula lacrimiformis]|uniref:Luminescence regulatory protein LuxO n=1 Tax=Rubripirellula lacrimiformis TaxID=1930273 RepID=A0A517N3G3_9BACT|nr:response regulator [Rubripirellula lacrimiformis]QDT01677.1 Luminescence regulatory protein LuxO [Rubripirellula lacrimiformis]
MSKILLVEDSSTHAALMKSILQTDGHTVEYAENGLLAFQTLGLRMPDLVVTDLRMPEMNGLELVKAITSDYPQLPSVVVTARGSESLAVDALALGATDFVPKNSLSKLLGRVVRQTIQMAAMDRLFDQGPNTQSSGTQSSGTQGLHEYSVTFASDITSIESAALFLVQSLAASGCMNTNRRIRLGTAVRSALLNAICFGNLEIRDDEDLLSRYLGGDESALDDLATRAASEPYAGRKVELRFSIGKDDTRILVRHNGRGRVTRMSPAPGTPESFELEQCRGLMLMTSFMDDVIFRSGNTEVIMVKQHAPATAQPTTV